ncbi:hypothetical protein B0A48_06862 [Cryoendolithus antarcticus]|uniref:Uncharacterized protein n=1 Tax=Cryoendolithus antarcticus TaxID=1507870 RepID=A0A1V8T9P1_9PEZI|nr:hypothetical protein B0A48_06862 [Cryoendolithus antarcticus]
MSVIASDGRQTTSPGSSRASSPVPHLARRTAEDASWKSDRSIRRYAASIARALSTWEAAPEEWADYIAFLGRLLKAVQSHSKDATVLPHADAVALRLAQCLSPALPSGVHQRALEIYGYIFETFGTPHVAKHLSDYLPGLSTVLSFASLSVRPALYGLLENYVLVLSHDIKRPVMKSLILSMLPALEEETSEDFERAFDIVRIFELGPVNPTRPGTYRDSGFFWQCMFLAILTGVSRRQGALNYLVRQLPSFWRVAATPPGGDAMSPEAESAIAPEPGLLVRAFATGLSDSQPLVQRGFLDLLVSHLPLDSPVLQFRVASSEIDRLMMAATGIALRRDMSLNRRLWTWLLGSDANAEGSASPTLIRRESAGFQASMKQDYFDRHGLPTLRRCILSDLSSDATGTVDLARPFRICHTLMERWEIGDTLIPEVFLPAMRRAYGNSEDKSAANVMEVMKSARTFFDGVESRVIWGQLFRLLDDTKKSIAAVCEDLRLFLWILQSFNVAEEEMIAVHVPVTMVFLLAEMKHTDPAVQEQRALYAKAILLLLRLLPADTFGGEDDDKMEVPKPATGQDVRTVIRAYYTHDHTTPLDEYPPIDRACITAELLDNAFAVFDHGHASWEAFIEASDILIALHKAFPAWNVDSINTVLETCQARAVVDSSFEVTNSIVDLLLQLSSSQHCKKGLESLGTDKLIYRIVASLWDQLSPMNARHQLEAVQLLWQMDGLDPSASTVKAALSSVMGRSDVSRVHGAVHDEFRTAENLTCFAVLWKHSVPTASAAVSQEGRSLQRRGSVKSIPMDGMAWVRRRDVMGGPLFMTIDAIRGSSRTCQKAAMRIFGTVASSEVVLQLLLGRLAKSLPGQNDTGQVRKFQQVRDGQQRTRGIAVVLQQIESILRHANNPIWQSLMSLPNFTRPDSPDQSMVAWLTTECAGLIGKPLVLSSAKETAISILDAALHGPEFIRTQIQTLDLADVILQCVLDTLSNDEDETRGRLLDLALSAMTLRQSDLSSKHDDESLRRSSVATQREPSLISRDPSQLHVRTTGAAVSSKLLATLKAGFAAGSARRHMDVWLDFLTSSLHFFGDGLITVLIPLVDMFCAQLTAACIHLRTFYLNTENTPELAPDVVILWLLDGLDIVLAEAHDFNIGSMDQISTRSLSEAAQGGPSSTSSKAQGSSTGINTANSRLTLVLALKDAAAMAMDVWLWSAQAIDVYANIHSSLTASNTAVRLRSRSRSMLEQIYTVQTLETIEVMIHKWCHATKPHHSASVLSLLQAMTPARPRSILPATLNAVCSRCHSGPASPTRQSSLTTELTAAEILSFLAAYLGTVDADATDEIWPDCTAFMRDVLSNPMPFRQVLPGLLWIASILAEHLANTNYGDQRKMRRELGDLFQRLLAACSATLPSVTHPVASTVPQKETVSSLGQRSMDITVILTQMMPHIDNLLDASDRVANAVNAITSGIISHELHAKAFPANVHPDTLVLLAALAVKAPTAKPWRKEVSEAFMRPRFLETNADVMQQYWMPVLHHWAGTGKEQVNDLLSRLIAPSSAGIMFGVGAAAARIKADIETQTTLRRLCVLYLASPTDTHLRSLQAVMGKLTELFDVSALSSPSAAVKQEIFMVCRVLVLSVSPARLTPMWPLFNSWLKAALVGGLAWTSENADNITNLALLQACKLLEVLLALSPNEFQPHEWLWVTDTTDAIHHSNMWRSAALSDRLAEELSTNVSNGTQPMIATIDVSSSLEGDFKHQHMIEGDPSMDTEDIKAMSREQFAISIIRPYFSQLSINTYEAVYQMKAGSVF